MLERNSKNGSGFETAPSIVHEVLRSPGQPLDLATRAYFEPRFGYDFSRVRVHSDVRAIESAQAIDAEAYAAGHHLVFGAGNYAPGTSRGQRIIAHESTHVVQQSRGPVAGVCMAEGLTISHPADPFEQAADQIAKGSPAELLEARLAWVGVSPVSSLGR